MNDLACLDDGEEPPAGQCPRRLVAHLIAERRASDFDELVPTPRENAAHAGRAAGRDHKILVKIIVVLARPVQLGGDVSIAVGKGQAAIGDDRVPIRHDVGLGHHREGVKVGLGERLRIDAAQPAGVPGGMRLGVKQGLAHARWRSALICSAVQERRSTCAGIRAAIAARCSRLFGLSMIMVKNLSHLRHPGETRGPVFLRASGASWIRLSPVRRRETYPRVRQHPYPAPTSSVEGRCREAS